MTRPPLVARTLVAVVVAAAAVVGASCSRNEFDDRTATVTVDGRVTRLAVDSCGLDERTLFVVGRADDGSTVQVVVGLEDDRTTGVVDSTGLTFDADGLSLGAFGTEAWSRRGRTDAAPGTIRSAGLRGSRIQVGAEVVALTAEGGAEAGGEPVDLSFDARCDRRDEAEGS